MPTRAEINREVAAAARRHGVDPNLFAGLVRQESGFNPAARSPVGAIGLAQLMPKTAAGLGVDPHDWRQNLDGGARYLQNAMRINKGNLQRVLASYNAGQGAVDKYGGIPPYAETQNYVKRVLANMHDFKQSGFDRIAGGAVAAAPQSAPLAAASPAPSGGGLQAPAPDPTARQGFLQNLIDQNAKLAGISSVSVPLRAQAPAPVAATPTATTPVPSAAHPPAPITAPGAAPTTGGLPIKGKVAGGVSDHMSRPIGNWQSDNALDIAAPVGSPVYAVADGVIGSRIGSLGSSNPKMAGLRVNLQGAGNAWYYAHLSRLTVKAGQRVKKGQVIGYSGAANGLAHLHFGQQNGAPNYG